MVKIRGRRNRTRWVDEASESGVDDPDYVPEEDQEDERGVRSFRREDDMQE